MHRRTLLATTTTALTGLGGCITGIGSSPDGTPTATTPTEPPYETLSRPVCINVENLDDRPRTLTITVEIDGQPFRREFDLDASGYVEDWCFDRAGSYRIVAESATGQRDARDVGEMDAGLYVRVDVGGRNGVEVSPPGVKN